jgi:hypothetical protein
MCWLRTVVYLRGQRRGDLRVWLGGVGGALVAEINIEFFT